MATNEVFRDADNLSLPVPAATLPGVAVVIGSAGPTVAGDLSTGLVGVTQTKEGEGGNPALFASVMLKGAHKLPVTGAITVIGQRVFIPAAGGALTATVGTNVLFGQALELKAAGTATITVRVARS